MESLVPPGQVRLDLEAAIELDPDNPRNYLVYADWLQAQGDRRGELIAVQHAMKGLVNPARFLELKKAEAAILQAAEGDLLGPLQGQLSLVKLSWRYGFLHSAAVRSNGGRGFAAPLQALIECPSSRFLEELALFPENGIGYASAFELLVRWRPATLRALALGNPKQPPPNGEEVGDLAALLAVLPKLRRLTLSGRAARFDPSPLPDLQRVELSGAALEEPGAAAVLASLPATLTYLRLDYAPNELERAESLQRILSGTGFPTLKHLVLASLTSRVSDEVCVALGASPLARQLETLDLLSTDATDQGARQILAHQPSFARLKRFALKGHFSHDVYRLLTTSFPSARIVNLTRAARTDDERYDGIHE